MECPVCRESMVVIEHKSIELDYCVGCMGVWFDCGEIELLLESAGIPVSPGAFDFIDAHPQLAESPRLCPLCDKPMQKVSPPGSQVILDRCPDGEGVWFDAGEIAQTIREVTKDSGNRVLNILREFLGEAISPSKTESS
ncbi:MAG: zf-TFIIB domain-containing protein [bacterium]